MANPVDPATVGGVLSDPGSSAGHGDISARNGSGHGAVAMGVTNVAQLGPFPAFHGRKVSWVAVSIIMAGFLIGGLSLVFGHHGPTWWLFWIGAGVAVLGLLVTLATNTFEDWY